MIMWILTAIVYVFFIYGVIEFLKNIYIDFFTSKNKLPAIQVLIKNEEELEYTVRSLNKNFSRIILMFDKYNEGTKKAIKSIENEENIEYLIIKDIGEAEKSE